MKARYHLTKLNLNSKSHNIYVLVIEQFDNQDRHEFDDQMALEVHSMKEHLFTLLSKIQAIDGRLPGTVMSLGSVMQHY